MSSRFLCDLVYKNDLVCPVVFCVIWYIKDPLPLIEKSRASCTNGRFPPSFIHQVIIIDHCTEYVVIVCSRPEDGLRWARPGRKTSAYSLINIPYI